MDLFTPSPKPRKRPSQTADATKRTKAKTPQSTRSESLASNSRASREPTTSTRRKPENAKAGPSKLGKQPSSVVSPPTRQSSRVSRPTLKKAAGTEIILPDEDSDLPSPSSIFKKVPKTPARPKKRKRASSPLIASKKVQKVICLEISDSDDDGQTKARPVKRTKVTKKTAPEDVINLCSSSEVEGPPPSSPLAQARKRKSSPERDAQNAEAADTEARKSKRPSREKAVATPEVADVQPEVNLPMRASSPPPPPSPKPLSPPVSSLPLRRSIPLPTRTRIKSMRMVRNKSLLSGRESTRPERESEITYFEPDSQPRLNLLTPIFFKRSVASVKAKIEVQKRKKKKAAVAAASASTSAPVPANAPHLDAQTALRTLPPMPVANISLMEPPDSPPQLDDTSAVSIEQTVLETAPLLEPVKSILPQSIPMTCNEASKSDAGLALREIPEIEDLVASAKHVTTLLDKLKTLKSNSSLPSTDLPHKSSQPSVPLNTGPNSSAVDEAKTPSPSPPPPPRPAESGQSLDNILTPIPAAGVNQDPPTPAADTQIETSLQLKPPCNTPASSGFPLLSSLVRSDQDDSNNSRESSTSTKASASPGSPPAPTTTLDMVTNQLPAGASAQTDVEAAVNSTQLDLVFPALGLNLITLTGLAEVEGDAADYDDLSLSDLELVYPEDLAI